MSTIELPYGYRIKREECKTTLTDLQQRHNAGDPRVSQRDLQIAANQLENVESQIKRYREIEQARLDKQAEHEQARELEAAKALDEEKVRLRALWQGSAADFDAVWDGQLKQETQLRWLREAQQRAVDEAQRRMNGADPGWVHVPIQQDILR